MTEEQIERLPSLLTPEGRVDLMAAGLAAAKGECPLWEDIAAEVIRLRAAAKEAALQIDALKAREAEVVALVTEAARWENQDAFYTERQTAPWYDTACAFLAGGQP